MDSLNPSVVFDVGYAEHQQRIARGEAMARLIGDLPPRRSPRVSLAAALASVARRLAPSVGARGPAEAARA